MPKPIFQRPETKTDTQSALSLTARREQKLSPVERHRYEQKLRQKRSPDYVRNLTQLDAGGKTHNHAQIEEIIKSIKKENPDLLFDGDYVGYFCKCYLGKPFEVHIFDMYGKELQNDPADPDSEEVCIDDPDFSLVIKGIIKHFKKGEPLPGDLESARGLVVIGGYELVEVYTDCFRAISKDGTVALLPRTN